MDIYYRFLIFPLITFFATSCASKVAINNLARLPAGERQVNLTYQADRIENISFEFLTVGGIEYPKSLVPHPGMLLVVHSSDLTEPKKSLRANIERLSKKVMQFNFSQYQLAMTDELKTRRKDIYPLIYSSIFPFEGDSHRISHAGDRLILAGGNLTRCLCTALQSYLALARSPTNRSTIYFPMDAIYEGFFNDPNSEEAQQQVLSQITEMMTDSAFSEFTLKRFVGPGSFCPDYPIQFIRNPSRTYQITIERNGKVIHSVGSGNYHVRLVFLKTIDLIQLPAL